LAPGSVNSGLNKPGSVDLLGSETVVPTTQHLQELLLVATKDREWPIMLDLKSRTSGESVDLVDHDACCITRQC